MDLEHLKQIQQKAKILKKKLRGLLSLKNNNFPADLYFNSDLQDISFYIHKLNFLLKDDKE
jgi:hypothetical protein